MRELITEIPSGNYTGYYWMSDAEKPVLVEHPEAFPNEALSQMIPFIVEGNLYDEVKKISIYIRHNGKGHVIYKYNLNNPSGFEMNMVSLIAHRLDGMGRVTFIELWKEEGDPLCENLKTLRPYARVFVGF